MKARNLYAVYKFLIVSVGFLCLPLLASAEVITNYSVDITLEENADLLITEEITYNYRNVDRHGIFRTIPLEHSQPATAWYKQRHIEPTLVSATRNGLLEPVTESDANGMWRLKIGDPDKEVSDVQVYEITYRVRGALSYFEAGPTEIYWDAIGHEWQVPIRAASVTLRDPHGLFRGDRACYRGMAGEIGSCGGMSATSSAVTYTSRNLTPGEGMTVAQALRSTEVPVVLVERIQAWWFWMPVAVVWFLILGVFIYRYRTVFKPNRAIIPEYEPFEHYKPVYTGLLIDGKLDHRDITAGIVYLAEQGYITIKETERTVLFFFEVTDYELTLTKDPEQIESYFLRKIIELLFGFVPQLHDSVRLSELRTDDEDTQRLQVIQKQLREAVLEDLVEEGFYESSTKFFGVAIGGLVLLFFMPLWFGVVTQFIGTFLVPLCILLAATTVMLGLMYKRRTRRGYDALWHLKGFKEFLSVTEKERYAFHNAPEKNPQQFMEYLPYAIAFGVEDKWAEVFKDITIPQPKWYQGTSNAAFSATSLTKNLSGFSQSLASSGASSSGGSGGRGSVGGGSGGGGGGSW